MSLCLTERIFNAAVVGLLVSFVWGWSWKSFAAVIAWAVVSGMLSLVDHFIEQQEL